MKLHIFGASGSGVTTTGKALAQKLKLTYFDSDDYFWLKTEPPFTEKQNREERNYLIAQDLNNTESWVLGGSIIQWGDNIFPTFDLIIFLYLPRNIRIDRLKKREYERYGDRIFTDPDKVKHFEDFLKWANDYDDNSGIATRTLQAHENWLKNIDSPILKIIGDLTTDERIELITTRLSKERLLPT